MKLRCLLLGHDYDMYWDRGREEDVVHASEFGIMYYPNPHYHCSHCGQWVPWHNALGPRNPRLPELQRNEQ